MLAIRDNFILKRMWSLYNEWTKCAPCVVFQDNNLHELLWVSSEEVPSVKLKNCPGSGLSFDIPYSQTALQHKLAENFLFHYFELFWLYLSLYRSACMTSPHGFILCLLYKLRLVLILSQTSHHLSVHHHIFVCVSRNYTVISSTIYFEIHCSFIFLCHQ